MFYNIFIYNDKSSEAAGEFNSLQEALDYVLENDLINEYHHTFDSETLEITTFKEVEFSERLDEQSKYLEEVELLSQPFFN